MSEDFEHAKRSLAIKSVTLRQSSVVLADHLDVDEVDFDNAINQGIRGVEKVRETSIELEEQTVWEYHFFYTCGIRIVEQESADDIEALVEIRATFNAIYVAQEQAPKESIEAFAEENVGYHVWPYWRELVQSSCARLNVKCLETPFYLVGQRK